MRMTTTMSALIVAVIAGLFGLKYKVTSLEDEHRQINNVIRTKTNSIRILKAEYNYLSNPKRMRELAQKHTQLRPIHSSQIFGFEEIRFARTGGRKQ